MVRWGGFKGNPHCPGASGNLGSLQKPLAALGLHSDSGALLPLLPRTLSHSLLLSLAPPHSPHHLSLPRPLGPSWGLRKPWKPLEAFSSLGSSVRLRGLAPLACPIPPHSPLFSLMSWASLGPWDLPGASRSLESLQKPSAALGLQSDLGALLPLLPLTLSCSFLLPLAPPCSPLPPEPPSLGLRKPLEPSAALGLQSDLGALLPLLPLTLSCSFLLPLAPPCSPLPLSLPGPLGHSCDLRKPWEPWASLRSLGSLGSYLSLREQEGRGGVRRSEGAKRSKEWPTWWSFHYLIVLCFGVPTTGWVKDPPLLQLTHLTPNGLIKVRA